MVFLLLINQKAARDEGKGTLDEPVSAGNTHSLNSRLHLAQGGPEGESGSPKSHCGYERGRVDQHSRSQLLCPSFVYLSLRERPSRQGSSAHTLGPRPLHLPPQGLSIISYLDKYPFIPPTAVAYKAFIILFPHFRLPLFPAATCQSSS